MTEILKSIAAMENGGFILIGLAIVMSAPLLILGIVLIYNVCYYGAVLIRGWPPEYEDSDDDHNHPIPKSTHPPSACTHVCAAAECCP